MTGGGTAYGNNNRSDGLDGQHFEGSLRPQQDAGELHQSNLPQGGAAETETQSRETSLQVLSTLVGADRLQREPDAAAALCRLLGDHPLGVELAGRYLAQEPSTSVQALTNEIHQHPLPGIEAMLEIAWEKLDVHTQGLAKTLGRFAPDPIPWFAVETMIEVCADDFPEVIICSSQQLPKSRNDLVELGFLKQQNQELYVLERRVVDFLNLK